MVDKAALGSTSGLLRLDDAVIRNVASYVQMPLLQRHWYVAVSHAVLGALTSARVGASLAGKYLARFGEGHPVAPGIFVSRLWTEVDGAEPSGDGLKAFILLLINPVTKGCCLYWWLVAFKFGQDEGEYLQTLSKLRLACFNQDVSACEDMQRLLNKGNMKFDELSFVFE